MRSPRVFISYAHSSTEHKAWVKKLADALREQSIEITLDQDNLRLGQLIDKFQRDGISNSDRVLVICSETYVEKCDTDPASGSGREKDIMRLFLTEDSGTIKFVPLIRDNPANKLPACLKDRLWLNASANAEFDNIVKSLAKEFKK